MSVFGLVSYNEEQYHSSNLSSLTKEKCIYYNRTTGRIITPAYEGIPENLLLNFLGWIMLITLFACLRKRAWNYGRLALVQKNEESPTPSVFGIKEGEMYPLLPPSFAYSAPGYLVSDGPSTSTTSSIPKSPRSPRSPLRVPSPLIQHITLPSSQLRRLNVNVHSRELRIVVAGPDGGVEPAENIRWTQLFYGTLDDVVGATEVNSVTSLDSTVHIDRGFCSWIIAIFKIKDENILAKSGYDAVQYLSFQRHIIVLVAIICVISLAVVLPINFQGDLQTEERSFGHTTVSNLDPSSNFLWVHVTLSLLYLPLGIYVMRRFSVNLKVEDRDTVSRTLMISNIPKRACDADDLHRHFREAYPEFEVQGIQLAYNITKVSQLDKERETAYQARIYCDNYLKDTGIRLQMRPYLCGNICSCCDMYGCPTVDAIDYYTDEESRLQAQVDLERTTALKRPLGIVFVTLVSLAAAKKIYSDHQRRYGCINNLPESSVSRRLKHHRWKVQFAPSPRDICWENLSVSRKNFQIKAWLLNGLLSIVFFFLTTPPIIVSVMDTLVFNQVEKMGPVVSEFLPTLLLWTVAALLPVIVSHSDEWLSHWTRSQRNHSIMRKTFIFLLFMVLILPALGLTSAQAFVLFAIHSHNETYRWECLFMPDKGAFFVNYVITSAFIGTSLELIRFPELFVYTLRLCLARSKAESVSLRNTIMWEFPFGLQYAWMLLIFAMTTVFSLSCPLITPFGLLYMCLKHCVDRYNLYFAYGPSKISTRIHATAIKYVVLSIVLLQFSFMLLSVMRQGFNTISIYALTGFILTIIIAILHSNLRFCSGLSPIYHQAKPAPSASPSLSSPRHGAARHQFVPDVLLRGTGGGGDGAPRQPDLVTVYSPGDSNAPSQRNYGTDQHRGEPDSDSNSRYQNYDTNSTQA